MQSIWPLSDRQRPLRRLIDFLVRLLKVVPGYCNICASPTLFLTRHPNFREHVHCLRCGSVNRQRQIMSVLLANIYANQNGRTPWWASLRRLPKTYIIWTAETTRALHFGLKQHLGENCIASEFLNSEIASGILVEGILHVDIQKTHFQDSSLDYIITSDVLEHVPSPQKALQETYRILRPGGCHIFTVPFYHHRFTNEVRAVINDDGTLAHHRRPWYHDDPLRPEGVLAFTVFAPELLCLLKRIGFEAELLRLHSPIQGIYGQNALVIVARKAVPPKHARD